MTEQITIPREIFDQMQEALEAVKVLFGHLAKDSTQRTWLDKAREALSAAKAVSAEPEGLNPATKPMTADRAAYFMRRFKKEEKLLGPNEQAAVDYVISLLEQPQAQWDAISHIRARTSQHKWNSYELCQADDPNGIAVYAHPQASEPAWMPIETAPKDGRPVWVKGHNFGDESKGIHCCWAWHDGNNWYGHGTVSSLMMYLVSWMPLPAAPEATK